MVSNYQVLNIDFIVSDNLGLIIDINSLQQPGFDYRSYSLQQPGSDNTFYSLQQPRSDHGIVWPSTTWAVINTVSTSDNCIYCIN